ncbi:Fucoxanthin-chlorophyll a-c binding protein [Seminavis robusta]|uniref:Fucoxanthin-chlorophyll a-c binding protein n=1 Tax=Seminavis robusta TaxID=568900 RepID=A0A9N8DGB3_9STRA|nr:Fucoxanthin-chlorophyll a-c binding protein [Seminavis robusta]|eukprot:Sro137_g064500.1 Fucoxanthin-chlorophyll a-c binding protein (209) ;mRNA; f:84976-85602
MKTAIIASLIAGAAAFAPSQKAASSTQLAGGKESFGSEIGAQVPLGYWDPLGFMRDADQAEFDRMRWVELKHGRVAMLAVVGYLTTYAGVRFPGAEDVPCGFAALSADVPQMLWAQVIATWFMMEAANQDQSKAPWGTGAADVNFNAEFKGDFRNGFIDFGWDKQSAEWKTKKRALELNQGRAAQMGILGLMVHEKLGNVADILPLAK